MGVGEKLKNARVQAGLSQVDVNNITGINNKTLSNYECDISEPSADTLRTLCTLYRISADEIIDVPLTDQGARELHKKYLKSPRHIQEAIEAMLEWKPIPPADQGAETGKR
jgi:transcriptional regulator with XRE-family HTH domain